VFLILPGVGYVGQWLQSFAQFPPRQKPASFNLNEVMQKIGTAAANAND
jgi:arylsulfatase